MSFSFGTPSSAPASSGLTGFSFGANKPATPGFGLTATSQPSTGLFGTTPSASTPGFGAGAFGSTAPAFGATSATPAFGATTTPAFGATTTPAFGATTTPAFGAAATPAFGATATPAFGATSNPAFGATATPAFGATSTPAFGATTTPAFGATTTPAFGATTTPAFGSTATPAFGATSTPAFGATSAFGTTAPAFGSTTTPAFGSTTTPAFGASAAPAFGSATTSFGTAGLGTGLNFGTGTTSAAPTGLSFGAATTASTGLGGLSGFNFGGTTSAQSTGFAPFGSSGTSTTSTSLFGNKIGTTSVTGTLLSTSATPSLGLGGLAPTSGGVTGGSSDSKSEPPKQTKLPNEISTTVDTFKEFVKKQKSMSSEVMRISIKPLHKVSRDAEAMVRQAQAVGAEVARARALARRLRTAAAAALATAEGAARDYMTPGSELDGSPPPSYVKDLIAELEQQLIIFRRQMDVADKQLQSAPKLLTEQELTLGIRRMYESLVALAGRLQGVHAQVEAQKEQYLNLRKYILKDPTNVFDTPHPNTSLDQILRDVDDPRKRLKSNTLGDLSQGSAVLSDPRAVLGNIHQLAGPTPFSYVGSSLSPFPTTDTSGPTWQPQAQTNFSTTLNISSFGAAPTAESSTFQLQKPPGKRGKQ